MARTKQTARKPFRGQPARKALPDRGSIAVPMESDEEDFVNSEDDQSMSDSDTYDRDSQSPKREPETVRDEIANILKANPKFKGSFFCQGSYDAINPIINLKNVGQVGLPLSKREANHVIKHCRQVPFTKAERSVVGKDTWEMDAADVQFDNPAWASFLEGVVRSVCSSLGVNYDASKPLCALQKMLLNETGSHFLPRQDAQDPEGTFATMVIVLQSTFTGGEVQISQGGFSSVVDHSKNSLLSTSVMAWFTGVTHEMKPITSGYRIALSYNLIHTTAAARPSPPPIHPLAFDLRDIFLDWKDDPDGPQKIVYLLENQYPQDNLRDSALKGRDARKTRFINTVAGAAGFNVGLANLKCMVLGSAEVQTSCWNERGRWDDEDESDPDIGPYAGNAYERHTHRAIDDIIEVDWSITNLVTLNGQKIADTVIFDAGSEDEDESEETIPANFLKKVQAGGPSGESFDDECGNIVYLSKWYYRSVLVIWPQSRHEEIVYGDKYPQHILNTLKLTESDKASEKETRQVEHLLRLVSERSKTAARAEVTQTICAAACKWGDYALWSRAVTTCGCESKIADLGLPAIVQAVEAFPWDDILPRIAVIASKDHSRTARRDLFDELERLSSEYKPSDASKLKEWIAAQRALDLKSQKQKRLKAAANQSSARAQALGVKPVVRKFAVLPQAAISSTTRRSDNAPAAKRRRT